MTEIQTEHALASRDHPTIRPIKPGDSAEEPPKVDIEQMKRQILEDEDDEYIGRSDT